MFKLPDNTAITAVIFDFDGVIVDTEPLHYRAFQQILKPLSMGFSWEKYCEIYMGFDDRDAFLEAFRSYGKTLEKNELHDLVSQKARMFPEVIRDGVTPYPGVIDLIISLHQASVPLAISSGALLSDIVPILEMLKISDCFDIIVTADDVKKSKPDPESYRSAFQKLSAAFPQNSLTPAQTVAIEDTPAGITSARGAGLHVVAVGNSYETALLSEAHLVVDSLEKLLI